MKNLKTPEELNEKWPEDAKDQPSKKKYPELQKIVDKLADEVSTKIYKEVESVKSEMPYKAQWVLEELIAELEKRV